MANIAFESLKAECDFIPSCVVRALTRAYPYTHQLQRLLKQDWVRSWDGWETVASDLKLKEEESHMRLIDDCIISFTLKSMETIVFKYISDTIRKQQLHVEGFSCGGTSGLAWNSLSDSLLQVLVKNKMVTASDGQLWSDGVNEAVEGYGKWRRDWCVRVRQYLCTHDDTTLRPQERDILNFVRDTSKNDHDQAFLEHHRHAKAIFEFFLNEIGNVQFLPTRGCRLVVFSRFDEDLDPKHNAIELRKDTGSLMPPQDIYIYNLTGNKMSTLTYVLVFLKMDENQND